MKRGAADGRPARLRAPHWHVRSAPPAPRRRRSPRRARALSVHRRRLSRPRRPTAARAKAGAARSEAPICAGGVDVDGAAETNRPVAIARGVTSKMSSGSGTTAPGTPHAGEDASAPSSSRRRSGRLRTIHARQAELKAKEIRFRCATAPHADVRVVSLGAASPEPSVENKGMRPDGALVPFGYRVQGTLFNEPLEAWVQGRGRSRALGRAWRRPLLAASPEAGAATTKDAAACIAAELERRVAQDVPPVLLLLPPPAPKSAKGYCKRGGGEENGRRGSNADARRTRRRSRRAQRRDRVQRVRLMVRAAGHHAAGEAVREPAAHEPAGRDPPGAAIPAAGIAGERDGESLRRNARLSKRTANHRSRSRLWSVPKRRPRARTTACPPWRLTRPRGRWTLSQGSEAAAPPSESDGARGRVAPGRESDPKAPRRRPSGPGSRRVVEPGTQPVGEASAPLEDSAARERADAPRRTGRRARERARACAAAAAGGGREGWRRRPGTRTRGAARAPAPARRATTRTSHHRRGARHHGGPPRRRRSRQARREARRPARGEDKAGAGWLDVKAAQAAGRVERRCWRG